MSDDNIVVFIEISKGSNIKYEYNKELKMLVCDRFLHTPMRYFFNYGFVPDTLSLDRDPIDVVVITEESLCPGCLISCKIIGCLETTDAEGNDPKLIVCPSNKVDPKSVHINKITDLDNSTLEQIKYFFSHYKDLENKQVEIGEFLNVEQARVIYNESIERFKNTD